MKTIAIVCRKGGVGKTTTAINLSAALAERGRRVLAVDVDSQCHLTEGLGVDVDEDQPTIFNLLVQQMPAANAVVHLRAGLDLVPGSPHAATAEKELMLLPVAREGRLKAALRDVQALYDYCIIDTPPNLGPITINALTAADTVLIPVQTHQAALSSLPATYELVEAVRQINPALRLEGFLPTMLDRRTTHQRLILEALRNEEFRAAYQGPPCYEPVPFSTRYTEAFSLRRPITDHDRTVAGPYLQLAERIDTQAGVQ